MIEMNNKQVVAKREDVPADTTIGFKTAGGFATMQRVATALAASTLVPKEFVGNVPNCLIALNMAQRLDADPLMVMQNLYVVHGRPGWSSQFLIATFNQCRRFSAIRYDWQGEKGTPEWGCRAWAKELATGDRIDGMWITWKMAQAEGWEKKAGSKWLTIPELMFQYRAAAWFVRTHAPEVAMGLLTVDELIEMDKTGPSSYVPSTYAPPSEKRPSLDLLTDSMESKRVDIVDMATGEVLAEHAALLDRCVALAQEMRMAPDYLARLQKVHLGRDSWEGASLDGLTAMREALEGHKVMGKA